MTGLESPRRPLYSGARNRSVSMLALGIIFGFIAVLALINFLEFGRVD